MNKATPILMLMLMGLATATEADITIVGYGFYDINTSDNLSVLGLGMHLNTEAITCTATFGYQSWMTPDGQIITRFTNGLTTWLAQFLKLDAPIYCVLNTTAYATTKNGTIINAISSGSIGNLTLNNTGIPINRSVYLHSVAYFTDGSNITTETREYYIIGSNTVGGADMAMFTSMLAFVVLAAGFAYLHSKSSNIVWSSIWLSLMFVMILVAIMGMQIQANIDGDTQMAGIMMALFTIIFWILMVIMIIFGFNLVKGFLQLIKEAVDGKKK
jgi:hypothetical protein